MALRRVDNVWSLKPTPPHPAWAVCIQGVGPEHGWRAGTCEGACPCTQPKPQPAEMEGVPLITSSTRRAAGDEASSLEDAEDAER